MLHWPCYFRFLANLNKPIAAQDLVLSQIVTCLSNTKYGLLFNINRRDPYPELIQKLPLVSYEKLKHWILRQQNSLSDLLVNESVIRYELIKDNSIVPYTKSLIRSFYQSFSIQLVSTPQEELDLDGCLNYYRSYCSGGTSSFPFQAAPYFVEGPLFVKIKGSPGLLPLVSEVFFEFQSASKSILRLHEVCEGDTYELVITQKSGLYRYRTGIRVRVGALFRKTPTFEVLEC
ncbi:MAG: GH3 auxin-responsive promoter family protein [Myxococcaceae bacterium]|nr:GH3 auxin-responsive promoter family protein [Myxococcaceae bacterium]